jgi:lipoate-protein ligase A
MNFLPPLNNSTPPTKPNTPAFALRENDYVLGNYKVAGNAQSFFNCGWLHHTSFLWDCVDEDIMSYLQLPFKRPQCRQD